MKKVCSALILLALVCAGGPLSAQFLSKGAIIGSGSISFYSGKEKVGSGSSVFETKITELSVSPWGGYFIVDKVGVGLAINMSSHKEELDGSSTTKRSSSSIGPVVRFYPTDNGIFVQGYFGLASSKVDFGSGEQKESGTEWLIGAGYSIRITDTVLLDPMAGYTTLSFPDSDYTYGRFCISIAFTFIISE